MAKRQREMEKRAKAEAKRQRRKQRQSSDTASVSDAQDIVTNSLDSEPSPQQDEAT